MKKRGIFIFLIIILAILFLIYFIQKPTLSPGDHCGNLEDEALQHCITFNEINMRINNGDGYINDLNQYNEIHHWKMAWLMMAYLNAYKATEDTFYLDKLISQADYAISMRDDNRNYQDYNGQALAGWSDSGATETNQPMRFSVESGIITYPLVEFALLVKSDESLQIRYQQKANEYIQETEEVIAAHEPEYREGPNEVAEEDEGYYIFPEDAPVELPGINVPNNYQLAMGSTLISLYQLTNNADYLDKAQRVGRILSRDLTLQDNTYTWHYWPRQGLEHTNYRIEDMSHATIDLIFAKKAFQENIFNQEDMERFTRTFTNNIYQENDYEIAKRVDGTEITTELSYIRTLARWIELTNFDIQVKNIVKNIFTYYSFELEDNPNILLGYVELTKFKSNLRARYTFDENTFDLSGTQHDGKVSGNEIYVQGKKGKAIFLDGNSYVSLGQSEILNPRTKMSISIWIKPSIIEEKDPIIERHEPGENARSYYLRIEDEQGHLKFKVYNDNDESTDITSLTTIPVNRWTHVVITFNNQENRMRMFINEIQVASGETIGGIQSTTQDTTIGGIINSNSEFFNGAIDELKIYNKELSQSEINTLYSTNSQSTQLNEQTFIDKINQFFQIDNGR